MTGYIEPKNVTDLEYYTEMDHDYYACVIGCEDLRIDSRKDIGSQSEDLEDFLLEHPTPMDIRAFLPRLTHGIRWSKRLIGILARQPIATIDIMLRYHRAYQSARNIRGYRSQIHVKMLVREYRRMYNGSNAARLCYMDRYYEFLRYLIHEGYNIPKQQFILNRFNQKVKDDLNEIHRLLNQGLIGYREIVDTMRSGAGLYYETTDGDVIIPRCRIWCRFSNIMMLMFGSRVTILSLKDIDRLIREINGGRKHLTGFALMNYLPSGLDQKLRRRRDDLLK